MTREFVGYESRAESADHGGGPDGDGEELAVLGVGVAHVIDQDGVEVS